MSIVLPALVACADIEGGEIRTFDPYSDAEDADERRLGCDIDFGRSYTLDLLAITGPGEGFDLDGDGDADNALAFLGPLANEGWRSSMKGGDSNYLFDFTPWVDSLDDAGEDFALAFYNAQDADDDPDNNRTGEGEFTVSLEQFDVECRPTSRFDIVSVDTPSIAASSDRWTFFIPDSGTTEFDDMKIEFTMAPDMSGLTGRAGAVWTLCGLATSPFPEGGGRTFIDVIMQEFGVTPDMDRDGDGIEQIVFDDDFDVVGCIDGDGTELPGDDCPCDPRIADGYSIAFHGSAVTATIVDVTSVWD